jgi:hypothetical protein
MKLTPYFEFADDQNKKYKGIIVKLEDAFAATVIDLYCVNPQCDCTEISLHFVELDTNNSLKDSLGTARLNINNWELTDINIINKTSITRKVIAEFCRELDQETKALFLERFAESKAFSKTNLPDPVDDLALENGSCFGYVEVYGEKDIEKFSFKYKDKSYFVDDQYCTEPNCTCNEAILTFFEIVPGRKTQEAEFAIRLDLSKGAYQEEFNASVNKNTMIEIFDCFKNHFNNDFSLLRTRYLQMKEFGKKRGQRREQILETQKPKQITRSKVGRNDPCPCGSGKKYKKCCYQNEA